MKDYDGSESARRFFVNCEWEFTDVSIRQWIYRVEACFIGKAAEWVNQQSEIQDILDLKEPDEADKQRFIHLIKQKYPDRKPPTRKQWMTRLKELKQNENDESLGQYYRRTHEILRGLGGQDREDENDDVPFVLSHIIEKFVDGLNDRQLRVKLNYKYMIKVSFEAQSLYDVYLVAEEYSDRIASKKKALEDEFERELSTVMQTQGTAAALKFAMENQSEPHTQNPKSVPVDRIERYRPQQHNKPESTMQKNTVSEVFAATTAQPSELKSPSDAAFASKLTQPYTDGNSFDSNVSALGRTPGGPQTTQHSDSPISENMTALPSQSEPNRDPVSNEQVIRPEVPAEKKEPIEIYASGPSRWPAPTTTLPITISAVNESPPMLEKIPCNLSGISTDIMNLGNIESTDEILALGSRRWPASTLLPETTVVNKSLPVLQEKPYQMQENRSVSSPRASSSSRVSKPWLTQNWRARPKKTIDESPSVMEESTCNLPESCIVDITNNPGKKVASEFTPTSMQKPSFETRTAYESLPTLEDIPSDLPEINASIVDISETESKKDEVLASGSSNWNAAAAEKEVFDSTRTLHATSKSPPAPHIEKDIEAEEVAESIVDVETQNQEVFALAAFYDTISKNPTAPYSEDTEISTAVDMPSLEHLTNEDSSATEAFDYTTAIGAPLKNPSIQHTEDQETLEKNSVYTYELPAFPAFDLSIDIDFEAYTTDQVASDVTYSSSYSPVTPSISPVTLQAIEATSGYGREQFICSADTSATTSASISAHTPVTSSVILQSLAEETSGYGREQFSTCSVECHTTSDYEGEQITCPANTITTSEDDITITKSTITTSTVTKPVVHHALLAYCLAWIQHITLPFCIILWILYEYITLFDLPTEYKARPKVKIKTLLEPKHTDKEVKPLLGYLQNSHTNSPCSLIAGCACRMVTSSSISTRVNTSGISAVFAYKMALFSSELQGVETFNFEIFESTYGFGFRACKTVTWYHAIATRIKPYCYDISAISDICFCCSIRFTGWRCYTEVY